MQLLLPLFTAGHEFNGMLKVELLLLIMLELSLAARETLVSDGKLNPTVGGLSHGKYPMSKSPSLVERRTPWIPVALKIAETASIGLLVSETWGLKGMDYKPNYSGGSAIKFDRQVSFLYLSANHKVAGQDPIFNDRCYDEIPGV